MLFLVPHIYLHWTSISKGLIFDNGEWEGTLFGEYFLPKELKIVIASDDCSSNIFTIKRMHMYIRVLDQDSSITLNASIVLFLCYILISTHTSIFSDLIGELGVSFDSLIFVGSLTSKFSLLACMGTGVAVYDSFSCAVFAQQDPIFYF
jgi:hypothetical protein